MIRMGRLGPMIALAVAVFLSGCASGGSAGSGINSNVLTQAEIQEALASNLYEVVEKLRPRWLQIRAQTSLTQTGGEIGVFINRTHQGGVEVLRSLTIDGVTGMRYMDGPQASAALRSAGGTAFAGAIIVERSY